MREILFRGKNYDGEWIEGYYVHQGKSHEIYYKDYQEFPSRFVTPETVGQYTGLNDKNCVKVFEGDIVRIFDGEYFSGVVKYSNEQGSFTVDDTSLHYWVSDIEVIGNIHDNPDLLGGDDK